MERVNAVLNERIANSWFELARIIGIIAGFFFILAGLLFNTYVSTYIGIQTNLDTQFKLCDYITSFSNGTEIEGITQNQCLGVMSFNISEITNQKKTWGVFFLFIGFLLALNSIFIWLIGRQKLTNPYIKDSKVFGFLLLVDLMIVLLLWLNLINPLGHQVMRSITIDNRTFDLPSIGNPSPFS